MSHLAAQSREEELKNLPAVGYRAEVERFRPQRARSTKLLGGRESSHNSDIRGANAWRGDSRILKWIAGFLGKRGKRDAKASDEAKFGKSRHVRQRVLIASTRVRVFFPRACP